MKVSTFQNSNQHLFGRKSSYSSIFSAPCVDKKKLIYSREFVSNTNVSKRLFNMKVKYFKQLKTSVLQIIYFMYTACRLIIKSMHLIELIITCIASEIQVHERFIKETSFRVVL